MRTILIAEDEELLFRRGLVQLLRTIPAFVLVGEAASGAEGLVLARELRPDLILLDLNMRDGDGLDMLRGLRAARSEARVVMVTVSDSGEDVVAALRGGAEGYLLKDMEPEDVIASIGRAARGELAVAPALTLKLANMLQAGSGEPERRDLLASLTERERQILEHLARGESNKTIARALDISHDTVKLHVRHILTKLNLNSRVEAAVFAVEQRAAPPGGASLVEGARRTPR